MTHYGVVALSDEEVLRLREYFLKGGFLWADDAWGSRAWDYWVREIARVLPPGEFPILDIPTTHPIMGMLYNVKAIPQVPSINFWRRSNGRTSELGQDSAEVYARGIQDARGRLMVLMTHNTASPTPGSAKATSRGSISTRSHRPATRLASTSSCTR